eukprot:s2048_g15.t1
MSISIIINIIYDRIEDGYPPLPTSSSRSRLFWHCGRQTGCNFFRWVTHLERLSSQVWWQRLENFTLVQDTGFRADDLLQGAVGDCWFLSALAVIAERPDLILRLFRGETMTQRSGRYEVQLFLEGKWSTVVVDDQLPCIGSAAQRRPDGSGLAFSRAKDRQLWVPLVEKAYAKAHGSYKAISGGSVAEALLDLTGAPCESIDLEDLDRSPGELWEQLVGYHLSGLPMGCGTAGHPELAEVGLVGTTPAQERVSEWWKGSWTFSYSILDVKEVDNCDLPEALRCGGSETVQLLKLRNPHGMGEWNGEWSDSSAQWTELLEKRLGRTGSDDGTFWMDFMHFLMAFQVVDVCFAHRSWHSRSFQNCAGKLELRF